MKAAGVINGVTMKKTEELAKLERTAELSECFSWLEGKGEIHPTTGH